MNRQRVWTPLLCLVGGLLAASWANAQIVSNPPARGYFVQADLMPYAEFDNCSGCRISGLPYGIKIGRYVKNRTIRPTVEGMGALIYRDFGSADLGQGRVLYGHQYGLEFTTQLHFGLQPYGLSFRWGWSRYDIEQRGGIGAGMSSTGEFIGGLGFFYNFDQQTSLTIDFDGTGKASTLNYPNGTTGDLNYLMVGLRHYF